MRRTGFGQDRKGAVALLFALLLLPMIGVVGLAVDWSRSLQAKSQLGVAADAAAMAAATGAANSYGDGSQSTYDGAQAYGQRIGESVFKSLTSGLAYAGAAPVGSAYTEVAAGAGGFVATVRYSGNVSPWFGQLFKIGRYKVLGTSQVTVHPTFHNDIYFMIDNSSQASIAATPAAQVQANQLFQSHPEIWRNVPGQPVEGGPSGTPTSDCAFACHWTNNGPDFYDLAEQAGIPLRIDVMKSAVGSAISTMRTQDGGRGLARVGIFTFTNATEDMLWPPSSDLSNAQAVASRITLQPIFGDAASQHLGNTDIGRSINSLLDNYLAPLYPSQVNDGSANKPIKTLIILTDGINDQYYHGAPKTPDNPKGTRLLTTIDPSLCDRIKNYGIRVYVLKTFYDELLEDYSDPNPQWSGTYKDMVRSGLLPGEDPKTKRTYTGNSASVTMQACASSPDTYYEADTPQQISDQLLGMVRHVIGVSGLYTQ